jgi:spermidine synthase
MTVEHGERPRVIESLEGANGDVMLFSRATPQGLRYEITIGGHFVMAASDGPTERRLATEVLALVVKDSMLSVLVGGLGLGLTLAQTLADPRVTNVVVAEIERAVIRWNRTYLKDFNGSALLDRRVAVWEGDVIELIRKRRAAFDAILLDVDNGPSFLILEHNAPLYSPKGIKKIRKALADGGVVGVWSNRPDERLVEVLGDVFGNVGCELIAEEHLRQDLPPTAIYTSVKR